MLICKVSSSPRSIHYSLYATSPFLLTRPPLDCYILIGYRNRGLFYFFFCVAKHPFYGAILKLKVESEKMADYSTPPKKAKRSLSGAATYKSRFKKDWAKLYAVSEVHRENSVLMFVRVLFPVKQM